MSQALLKHVYHDRGDTIFAEGDIADNAYFLEMGTVDIVLRDKRGKEKIVNTVGTGEFFGEMALVDDQPRSATAVVKDDTMCVLITKEEFQRHLNNVDPFTQVLLKLLTKRLPAALVQ